MLKKASELSGYSKCLLANALVISWQITTTTELTTKYGKKFRLKTVYVIRRGIRKRMLNNLRTIKKY